MISAFERSAQRNPAQLCFAFCEEDGLRLEFDFGTLRRKAAALVSAFHEHGVQRGDCVSLDMGNCPAFVISILAAAYAEMKLVPLNHRLTADEKRERLHELAMIPGLHVALHLDEESVNEMIGQSRLHMRENIQVLERAAALFDEKAPALILFTSGTSGRPKAAELSWQNLTGAAHCANISLSGVGKGLWQLALPMFHVGGFEILIRCILNETPFFLYRSFDAEKILDDAAAFDATHISVVDKMLQDMIAADEGRLKNYECILLGGAAANPTTLAQASAAGARLYMSYGMTESSSLLAAAEVDAAYNGALDLLPGYEAHIISPDEQGVGQLAVRGPGVFERYLNARAAFTPEGYFLTGDRASMEQGRIKVRERLDDMFVSGGENIYPEEIRTKLLNIEGVKDAFVFGAKDSSWGRRPIASVERASDGEHAGGAERESNHAFAARIEIQSERIFSKISRPRHICVMASFPRSGIGKVDRLRLRELYDQRLEVLSISFHRISQKLKNPFITAKTRMETRESVIIEIKDHAGRVGLGECVAFPTDWYLPETLDYDLGVLKEQLAPCVQGKVFLHPREVSDYLIEQVGLSAPMARGALEPAFWDLYGKIRKKPFWQLLLEEFSGIEESEDFTTHSAPGLTLGIMPIDVTLAALREGQTQGYKRVKLKIRPGDDYERVHAVRHAFPDWKILLDANQSYGEQDIPILQKMATLDITCIEEPFAPSALNCSNTREFFARLSSLQSRIDIPICLDESILGVEDAYLALEMPELRCFALKIAKWGGVTSSLDFCRAAHAAGAQVWMGGMYETAISKRLHAAFQTLPPITIPGDIAATSHYFTTEISKPAFELQEGLFALNESGYDFGIGCELDYDLVARLVSEAEPGAEPESTPASEPAPDTQRLRP